MTIQEEFEEIKKFFKWISKKIFGKVYDELSLYVMSISFILILVLDRNSFSDLIYLSKQDLRFYIIIPGFIYGIILSIYHVFTDRKKTSISKSWMLYFALTLQMLVAMIALSYALYDDSISIIYPMLNFFYVAIMFKLEEYESLELFHISDRNTSFVEVFFATVVVGIVVLVSTVLFRNFWIETLSITVILGNQISTLSHKATSNLLKLDL